jgi:hypothetical protein
VVVYVIKESLAPAECHARRVADRLGTLATGLLDSLGMFGLAPRVVAVAVVTVALLTASATSAHTLSEQTVASGRWHGMKWEFKAQAADGAYCIAMTVGRGLEDGRSCGSMGKHGISYLAHHGRPAPNYVVGPVIAKARSVQIKFLDRPSVRISTMAPPPTLDRGMRFFAVILACPATPRSLVARDAAGRVVAQIVIPNRRFPRPKTC